MDTAGISDDVSFRLAYDEAVRALRGQADALNGLRQRAGTVLATTLVITSFFGGQALARGATPNSTGWLAVVAFGVAGVLSVVVLFPADLTFSTEIEAVVALVERASPDGAPYRELALALANKYRANNGRIAGMQWIFRVAAITLLVEALLRSCFSRGPRREERRNVSARESL
jgi:hypothetical protein